MAVYEIHRQLKQIYNCLFFRCADGGIFGQSDLKAAIEGGHLGLPPNEPLPNDDYPLPYTIIGDDAFPLKEWLLKPFPYRQMSYEQRIFNYRLCRARRIVENSFGILGNRWRVLTRHMEITPKRAELVVMASCTLHNMLTISHPHVNRHLVDTEDPQTHDVTLGAWRDGPLMENMQALHGNNSTQAGKAYRNYLAKYFVSDAGSVPWQDRQSRRVH